jgi:hypothetical protein
VINKSGEDCWGGDRDFVDVQDEEESIKVWIFFNNPLHFIASQAESAGERQYIVTYDLGTVPRAAQKSLYGRETLGIVVDEVKYVALKVHDVDGRSDRYRRELSDHNSGSEDESCNGREGKHDC